MDNLSRIYTDLFPKRPASDLIELHVMAASHSDFNPEDDRDCTFLILDFVSEKLADARQLLEEVYEQ